MVGVEKEGTGRGMRGEGMVEWKGEMGIEHSGVCMAMGTLEVRGKERAAKGKGRAEWKREGVRMGKRERLWGYQEREREEGVLKLGRWEGHGSKRRRRGWRGNF